MSLRLFAFLLVGVAACSAGAMAAEASPARPPNIVFFLADDLGYSDISCYGQQKFKTPNIDRLAAEGMKMAVHYTGNAVCAPCRCVFMTGKHPGHAAVRDNREMKAVYGEGQFPLPADTVTLPKLLKEVGYTTGAFG